jgi:signal transduction histidine kinase
LHFEPLALGEVVDDVVDSLQTLARKKSITVRNDVPQSLPWVTADRDKLHQVLTNLIQNAIKFTAAGGDIHIKARAQDDQHMRVWVTDTGCGIPSRDLEKVFEKFYRSESAPAESKGAGLGLAIVKTLVELQGGRLWATSEVGRGSQFFFTVPIHRPSALGSSAGGRPVRSSTERP